jgi:hypothetical protein
MKQKDIALILVIIFISAIFSLLISKSIFVSPKSRKQTVEVVQAISADFPKPDKRFFNDQAFDPTKLITIGQNANTQPFSNNSQ